MKALTVKQPWAHAIVFLGKNIENRSWPPPDWLVGRYIAIHAGKGLDRGVDLGVDLDDLSRGAILGIARITGVVTASRSRWFEGPLGWQLADARALPKPIARTGMLGLWNLTPDEVRRIRRAFPDLAIE